MPDGPGPADGPDVRIGTAERERAQEELSGHFSAGRIEVEEFEERCGAVAAARTRGELERVFADLPRVGTAVAPAGTAAVAAEDGPRPLAGWRGAVLGSLSLVAVVTFVVLTGLGVGQAWLVFLAIPAVAAAVKGYRGGA